MASAGKALAPDEFCISKRSRRQGNLTYLDNFRLDALFDAGASMVINGADEDLRLARRLSQALERFTDAPVHANLYVSRESVSGFGWHQDDHPALIWQIRGTKSWEFREHVTIWNGDILSGSARALELTEGDILLVPRGTWHNVTATGEPTMHLTFGFRDRVLSDSIAEIFRMSKDEVRSSKTGDLDSVLWSLKARDMQSWLQIQSATSRRLPTQHRIFASSRPIGDDQHLLPLSSRPPLVRTQQGEVEVATLGRKYTMPTDTFALYSSLFELGHDMTFGQYDATQKEAINSLATSGLIGPELDG